MSNLESCNKCGQPNESLNVLLCVRVDQLSQTFGAYNSIMTTLNILDNKYTYFHIFISKSPLSNVSVE